MNSSTELPALSRAEQFNMKQINLNNYYKNESSGLMINCQICKIDIVKANIFEHTLSKRHKYNKLFVGMAQGNYPNKDEDFIVLNRDKLQCRYCDFVTINSASDDIISHIEKPHHKMRKEFYLNRTNTLNARGSVINDESLKPLDSLVTLKLKNKFNAAKFSGSCGVRPTPNANELPKFIVFTEDNLCECTICTRQIPYTSRNIDQHINGRAHRIMMEKSRESSTIQERRIRTPQEAPKPTVARENTIYKCTTCNSAMINSASVIERHNISSIHLINVQRSRASLHSANYQRPTVSYASSSMDYREPTTNYYRPPVITTSNRRREESQCNIL